ncbi:hypothetical protein [Nostoc sp. TCL240-02]|uniref:hypothetical protein n=1 Tax=Nostoc sp. TCL240-02 TaxID=2572090 RepID=UPI00157FBD8B|nr:hypothetical protein [Nostoc sp. TCL240-02]QKQ76452.1 hypothetical protein FBB35_26990 [Nostoc sp. TCL240-02]
MSYSIADDEHETVMVRIGEIVQYIDNYGMQSEGEILSVDSDLNMLYVADGGLIATLSWIHADQLIGD